MNTTITPLLEQQRAKLRQLRDDTQDLAENIAEASMDRFYLDVEDFTQGGFLFDTAEVAGISLTLSVSMSFDAAIEVLLMPRLTAMQNAVQSVVGESFNPIDGQAGLDVLRKGFRLQETAESLVKGAIQNARPGVLWMLSRAFRDPVENLEQDMQDDAARVRLKMAELRPRLKAMYYDAARQLMNHLRMRYQEALDKLPDERVTA